MPTVLRLILLGLYHTSRDDRAKSFQMLKEWLFSRSAAIQGQKIRQRILDEVTARTSELANLDDAMRNEWRDAIKEARKGPGQPHA